MNKVSVDENTAAKSSITAALEECNNLQRRGNETTLEASSKALANCQVLITAAAADVTDVAGTSKRFVEYSGSDSSENRNIVVARSRNVAQECHSTDSGLSRHFCSIDYGVCGLDSHLNAYMALIMSPLLFGLPTLRVGCHRQC
ncbi:metalloproteinase [Colletotrichum orchidophilum]|uniref:Metalloproteinase n=1 Tax=Colletotrichum orchidophilum TaxID=1209926 RepID=A0A1G4B0V1_9PEZI|nr:metalloproteinase [Colletotrichum orchidophilum]OHE95007.1 metalloproteinase [Colletotrichum orchidophilum]